MGLIQVLNEYAKCLEEYLAHNCINVTISIKDAPCVAYLQ